ncbi:MAG: hypothetical protein WC376_05185, partial [Candidatus Nanoarchaeia archaeon]
MNSSIKTLSVLLILIALTKISFSITSYYTFDNMNGYLSTLDNYGVNNVLIKMNCSVKNDNHNIRVFSATTNAAGYYTFLGQGDYFSDSLGETEVTCFLWSLDPKVINNNADYKFNISPYPGNYKVGARYNLTYNYYKYIQPIVIVSPNPNLVMSSTSADLIVSILGGTYCKVNNNDMTKISENTFSKTMAFSHGANVLTISCTDDDWTRQITLQKTFYNDIMGPTISLVSPTGIVGASTTLIVSTSDAVSCTANSQAMTNVSTQFSIALSGLSNGANDINVVCLDAYSNSNNTIFTITSDALFPQLKIISPLSFYYNTKNLLLNISATDSNLNSVWYNWNGNNVSYSIPLYVLFNEGINTLHAWANDSVGNLNYTNVSFTVDTIIPSLSIVSPQNISYTNDTQLLNLSFFDVNLDSVWYNWNGVNESYTNAFNITFNEGVNVLEAWANDSVGNLNYTNVSFTVDTIIPSLSIVSPQNISYTNDTQLLNLSFFDVNLDSVWYNWNGVNESYTNAFNITFNEGVNVLEAWANDSVGNLNYTNVSFMVDSYLPLLEIITPQNISYNAANQLLNISSTGVSTWYNWLGNNVSYNIPVYVLFNEGVNLLEAWANNSIGAIKHTSVSFTVDTIIPSLSIVSPQNISYTNDTQLLNLSFFDVNLDSVWYNWNGTNESYLASFNITFNEGVNVLEAWANDSVGNLNYTNVSFTIDSVAPSIALVSPLSVVGVSSFVNVSTDELSSCYLNGSVMNTLDSLGHDLFIDTLVNGSNVFNISCFDLLGNYNESIVEVTADTVAPSIALVSPLSVVGVSSFVNVSTDELSSCYLNGSVMNTLDSLGHDLFIDTL